MASLTKNRRNRRFRLVFRLSGKRVILRLGLVSRRLAERTRWWVEEMASAINLGITLPPETLAWAARCSPEMQQRLAACGLIERAAESVTIGSIAATAFQHRKLAPGTLVAYGQATAALTQFFGAGQDVRKITPADAEAFRSHLQKSGLADATVCRRCGVARDIFERCVRAHIIVDNPFHDIPCNTRGNAARARLIPAEEVCKLMETAPSASWRALLALARWGGVRVPSEPAALRWAHIDWGNPDHPGRITVWAPKTSSQRVLPLFPQLRVPLEELFSLESPAAESPIFPSLGRASNLRTQLARIAGRAGIVLGPKFFTNCRATRDAELRRSYPAHIVCQWIGHTERVAQEHYLLASDESYLRVATSNPNQLTKETSHVDL